MALEESVIDEKAYPAPRDSAADKQRKAKVLFDRFKARPAERLSGVDLLKRLGDSKSGEQSFPSTSGVAALPFLQYVDNNQKAGDRVRLFGEIAQFLANHDVIVDEPDGALVFSSRLAELIPDADKLKDVVNGIEKILTTYAGKVRPLPYYALLIADGDNMGAAIDHQATFPDAQKRHSELSLVLSRFAAQVDDIVESHQGALVYSGGDDIMAYLPLHTVLGCAHELATRFADALSSFTANDGVAPTLSTGIAIVHHLEPLSDALDLARQAEKAAKGIDGKHALAITASKRSGADRTISGKREVLKTRLDQMIQWRRSGAISAGAAYELQELERVLGPSELPKEALAEEALRIINRKRETGGDRQIDTQVRDAFEKWIKIDKIKLQDLTLELIVASMFADAIDMAEGNL
ncbi:MAG: type III-B CRISPR-associated protein Cas10/Cmr2 [Anaerolineae bacterium]